MVQVDRTIFPSRAVIGQLIDHFRTCTGAEYPIFHIPSLLRLVDEVCFDPSGDIVNGDGTLASPADVCIVSRESFGGCCSGCCSELTAQWFWLSRRRLSAGHPLSTETTSQEPQVNRQADASGVNS